MSRSEPDATGLARMVAAREVTPRELVEAAIERIQRVDPLVNAVVSERFERALAEVSAGPPAGPFPGVPILLKDLHCAMAGEPLHAGARFLRAMDHREDHDAFVVRRLRAAGFAILGRTATPEFGTHMVTESLATGVTRNPWHPERSPGGSSGGAAAAVAAGMVPVAHGTDGAGSIRMPAGACGLVGLKPSRGRVSPGPAIGESALGATTTAWVSRSVRDAAALLDVLAGYMPGDPYTAPPPERPFREEVGRDPGALRIGLLDRPLGDAGDWDPECGQAVVAAARLLEDLGHHVELAHPPAMAEVDAFTARWRRASAIRLTGYFAGWERRLGRPLGEDDVEPWNLELARRGRGATATEYLELAGWLHGFTRRMAGWWHEDGWDLLVTPVTLLASIPVGSMNVVPRDLERSARLMRFTPQMNFTGQPAIALPLHWSRESMPVGVQLVAAFAREDLLLRVAAQLEAAQPWAHLVPPVHA
ncbi:MAG TPA: amidase [Candidatus Dormibacteraeota bacterium]|nr:amidase [Candidatus Dormibacteraeota bacterium]